MGTKKQQAEQASDQFVRSTCINIHQENVCFVFFDTKTVISFHNTAQMVRFIFH